jgi:glycosyltransferase involved in cell wall biosynthesis
VNILFIHNNFPGQFKHLAQHFCDAAANKVVAIGLETAPVFKQNSIPQLLSIPYQLPRAVTPAMHHYLHSIEAAVLKGQAVAKVLLRLRERGFTPDITFAHIGWGEALYFKDVFPEQPLVGYAEFYYRATGADVGFDPALPEVTLDDRLRIRTRNAVSLLSMADCDALISPTAWQKSLFPAEFQSKISVIHEGIDAGHVHPDDNASFTLANGKVLRKSDEVVTFTARNLEHYRGFHIFMQAVEEICKRRPNCHILLTGGDDVSYGQKAPHGTTYRQMMLEKVKIDPARVHFLGNIPYAQHLQMLQVSSAHVYLTYPFVLSWSFLEAMASACVIVASDTAPVKEVLQHEHNGLLVNFFDFKKIADSVDRIFNAPNRLRHLGTSARADIVANYALKQSLLKYDSLTRQLLKKNDD